MKEAELPRGVMAEHQEDGAPGGPPMTGPLFQQAVATMQTQESIDKVDGQTFFTMAQPIANQERCQGCHGTDHKVRAVVRVATSMEPVLAAVRDQRKPQMLVALLTIVAAAGVLGLAMRRVVGAPHPDWPRWSTDRRGRFPGARPDQFRRRAGRLGSAFNDMTERLSTAQEHLEARNRELATTLDELQASRQRLEVLEQLKGELSKFVPDAVKELLERDPSATQLEKRPGGSVRALSRHCRLHAPVRAGRGQEAQPVVQTYFSAFLEIIRKHSGDVNETAGDGLMVIFQSKSREPGAAPWTTP
jgi:hypothetical protein